MQKIIALMFSLEDDTFAACSRDGTAKLWHSKAFSPNLVFRANKDALLRMLRSQIPLHGFQRWQHRCI